MTEFQADRRSGVERREFQYTIHIPERRSGIDRRCAQNWKKQKKTAPKEKQPGSIEANKFCTH